MPLLDGKHYGYDAAGARKYIAALKKKRKKMKRWGKRMDSEIEQTGGSMGGGVGPPTPEVHEGGTYGGGA